jgi:Tfp pilus assembly protein PilV
VNRVSSRRRSALSSEVGTTLVELLIVMLILGVILPVGLRMLTSVQSSFNTEIDRSVNATQAGLVMQQLEKEIQSAEAFALCATADCASTPIPITDPLYGGNKTMCTATSATASSLSSCYFVVYTQTNASTRELSSPGPNAPFSCVQWRIYQVNSSPALYVFQSQRWQPDWEGNPAGLAIGWRYVSDPLPTVAATFTSFSPTSVFGGRLMEVSVSVNNQSANKTASNNITSSTTLTRQLTGSNIVAAPNPCIPPNGTVPS